MELRVTINDITQIVADAIIVNLFEGVKNPGGATGKVDTALDGAITSLIEDGEITGRKGQNTVIHTLGKLPAKRVIVAGLGKSDSFSVNDARGVAADAARQLRNLKIQKAATIMHGAGVGNIEAETAAEALAEGTILGLYTFNLHKTDAESKAGELEELIIVEQDAKKETAINRGLTSGRILADSTSLARDMANQPANKMTPTILAEQARQVAQDHGLEFNLLEQADCAALGMGAFLGVSQGSNEPPKFIVMGYHGDPSNPENNLGIIGKSGAGKSTLLRCVNLLEKPTRGDVIVNNHHLLELNTKGLIAQRHKMGMIFQHFNLLASRNIFANIALPLELLGFNHDDIEKRVDELLQLVDLNDRRDYFPDQLSGGQKQRVAIARALASEPHVYYAMRQLLL